MSDSKGRKTKRITFNLHERGRQFLGKDRSNVDMNEMIKQINSPQVQEMAKTGTLYGYNGHEIRKRYGMNPPDSVIVDGKVVYLERAFRTLEVYADKEGNVSHVTEFLDNPSGEYARKQYQARVGGFSSAQNYKRAGLGLIPVGFYGFDSAAQPPQPSPIQQPVNVVAVKNEWGDVYISFVVNNYKSGTKFEVQLLNTTGVYPLWSQTTEDTFVSISISELVGAGISGSLKIVVIPDDEDSELAGYYLVNNSLTTNKRVQLSTSAVSEFTGLVTQNPSIDFSGDTMKVCLSPNTVDSGNGGDG